MKLTHVYIYNANAVGEETAICEHGCHTNGLIKSFIDQDDEHINVVADDSGVFAFLWLGYSRLFGKGKTTYLCQQLSNGEALVTSAWGRLGTMDG